MSFASWLCRLQISERRSRRPATKRPFHAPPMLEALENRTLPSAAPFAATFVATLYQGFLRRNPSSADLTYWTNQMSNGATTTNVAQQILTSPEAFSDDIQADYSKLLGRNADSAGEQYWQSVLQNGASLQQVEGGIAGSAEFFQKAGGTNDTFVKALYQDILGRSADPSGETYFDNQLPANDSAQQLGNQIGQVADQITNSPEAANDDVNQDYKQVLGRPADSEGLSYWQPQVTDSPDGEANVAGAVAGSQEYSTAITDDLPSIDTADPNVAAQTFIADNGLYQDNSSSTTSTEPTSPTSPTSPIALQPNPLVITTAAGNTNATGQFTITNEGTANLTYQLSGTLSGPNTPLPVTFDHPTGTIAPGQSATVTVGINASSLSAATYKGGTINVSYTSGGGTGQTTEDFQVTVTNNSTPTVTGTYTGTYKGSAYVGNATFLGTQTGTLKVTISSATLVDGTNNTYDIAGTVEADNFLGQTLTGQFSGGGAGSGITINQGTGVFTVNTTSGSNIGLQGTLSVVNGKYVITANGAGDYYITLGDAKGDQLYPGSFKLTQN